jgi:hypothetical protein
VRGGTSHGRLNHPAAWLDSTNTDDGHPDPETDAALASIYAKRALPAIGVEGRKSIITSAREWLARKVAP